MTPLLEKAFARAAGLSPDAQNALALILLDDLDDLVPWLPAEDDPDDGWGPERDGLARRARPPVDGA